MLDGMRKASQTWLGKAVLTLMFSFLILSFAIWGIGDIFRGFNAGKVARAGNTDISAEEFRQEYQTQLQRLQQMTRQAITNEQARAFGLDQQVLNRLLSEAILDQRAHDMGLAMSDEHVRNAAFKDPEFAGPTGSYDRTVFLDKLRNAGLDEKRFAARLRSSYLRQELTGSLVAGLKLPQTMLESVFRYANETRSVEYFTIGAAAVGDIAAPTADELNKYFAAQEATFRAPEYRKFVTLAVTPATLADPAKVSQTDLTAFYERVKGQRFTTPETRQVYQIVFKSGEEKEAAEALAKIKAGDKFADVAGARNLKVSDIDLGSLTADKLTDPAVSKAVFALKEGETTDVIAGRFGPVLAQAVKVQPAVIKSLDEVAALLRGEIAEQQAQEAVQKIQAQIEDQRTSGKVLDEAAKSAGLSVRTVEAIDATGRDKAGAEVKNLVEREALLKAVFASDVGVDNDTITTKDRGYVWFEVAGVEPARNRTLDEIRPQIEAAWKSDQVAAKLREKAEALVKEIDGGRNIEDVAKEAGVTAEHIGDVKRAGHQKLATGVVERMFSLPVGKSATALSSATERVVFKILDSATPPYESDNETVKSILPQIERAFTDDIASQYLAAIQKEVGVTINTAAVRNATGASEGN